MRELLLLIATAVAATAATHSHDFLPAARPTPVVSRLAPRPTPAPTSAPPLLDDAWLPRTEVYVMEKCCPFVSHFAIREYPSAMEDDGWVPGLTFHAYKYQRWLPNCWQIVNTTESDATVPAGSQRWRQIQRLRPPKTTAIHATSPSPRDSFCLPSENRFPDTGVSVYYVESGDARASFISQPIRTASQRFFETFTLGGWDATVAPMFRRVFPLAYYYWRKLMPMPGRLITDVRMHAAEPTATLQCDDDYEMVAGNLNYNFVGDPVVYFCVRYGYGAYVDPRFDLSAQPSLQAFVTDIVIKAKTPHSIRNETPPLDREIELTEGQVTARRSSRLEEGNCNAPLEAITSRYDFWTQRVNQSGERNAQLDLLNTTLSKLNATTDYSVFTGNSEWLVFCMAKEPLVDTSNGRYRSAASFVDRLYLDLSRILRRQRLGVVYNVDELPVEPKQSPRGRIYYDIEDAKDAAMTSRGNAFDEL